MPDRESKNEKPRQSPGPRTDEGKQRSSQNALLHGCCSKTLILPGESQDEFDRLFESWLRDYRANTFVLQRLVHETVAAQWLLIRNRSRYNQYEHSLHEREPNCLNWSEAQHKQYERFHRYLRQAERRFHSAFQNLERTCGRRFREAMQLQHAQERAAAIELRSAQGPAARRHTTKELACPLGGALDPGPVVREFLGGAKDAAARHQSGKELARPSGGALDTAAVLRVFSGKRTSSRAAKSEGERSPMHEAIR